MLVPTRPYLQGADLANLVNEAALLAGRKGLKQVGMKQFEDAVMRTVAGIEKKRSLLSEAEKATVSAHEAGHAVVGTAVGCLLPGHPRPEQLSIVSRSGGALGYTYIPPGEEDRKLMFADELRGRLVTLMGGRGMPARVHIHLLLFLLFLLFVVLLLLLLLLFILHLLLFPCLLHPIPVAPDSHSPFDIGP